MGLTITKSDAAQLAATLERAAEHLRERAVYEELRADGSKAVRDRPMTEYHRRNAADARRLAAALDEQVASLRALLEVNSPRSLLA